MINLPPWLRKLPLLDRWLFGELTGPLLFAIAAFTVVSLSVGVMFDLVRRIVESGLPVTVAVQVMALKLPSFLVISFPMATLMATLLAYSRLSANSELTALRSVGVSTLRLVAPALVLAILLTGRYLRGWRALLWLPRRAKVFIFYALAACKTLASEQK